MLRKCLVCGKEFEACNTCLKGVPDDLQWRRVVCCQEHFNYHLPIIQYARKMIDKKTAKRELQMAIDNYGVIDFCDNVKDIVSEILVDEKTDDAVIVSKTKKKTNTKPVDKPIEETTEE